MKSPTNSSSPNYQEQYSRARDNPFFDGMRTGDAVVMRGKSIFDFHGRVTGQNISRSASDIGHRESRKILTDISENLPYSSSKDSSSDISLEPFRQSMSASLSKISRTNSSPLASLQLDLSIDVEDENELTNKSSPTTDEADEEFYTPSGLPRPSIEITYSVNKRTNLIKIPLPPSAASFYNGNSSTLEIVQSCEGIGRVNRYLKATRDDVNAGVPGRFLHAVIGKDVSDVGSVASTIMYAFYLNETLKNNQFCTVPVINMKRTEINSHAELKWLLDSCQIDQASLIFVDEIDLSYYDLFGSLKLVLLNGAKLPSKQEALKEALIEIFNCRKGDPAYPGVDTINVGQECSCCTLIAQKFVLTSPEILAGQGFSRLLLAGILMDTGNLTNPDCTTKDKYMATLLINGAGRFGINGLYQILRYKMYDISDLKVEEILRKEFRKWTKIDKPHSVGSRLMVSHIGMSSIGTSISQFLARAATSTQDILYFQQLEKLRLLMIVSGYYDIQKNFKREILISAESTELMANLLQFFNSKASQMPLKILHQPGVRDEMRAFEIDKVTSRKTLEHLLEEFSGTSKR